MDEEDTEREKSEKRHQKKLFYLIERAEVVGLIIVEDEI